MEKFEFDCIVVGGGIVGLSIAYKLVNKFPKIALFDKNSYLIEETSSRNSSVIHSGIYYPSSSLKAKFSIEGNKELYEFCKKYKIPVKITGKLIVAKSDQETYLEKIYAQGNENEIEGLSLLEGNYLRRIEPELSKNISYGIQVKSTGVIDVHEFGMTLEAILHNKGAQIIKNAEFIGYDHQDGLHESTFCEKGELFEVSSRVIIFACGLHSFSVGKKIFGNKEVGLSKLFLVKGRYMKTSKKSNPFSTQIYPIPDELGLGIHYTIDINGDSRFGPDTEFTRNLDYTFSDDPTKKFKDAISCYWDKVHGEDLVKDYVGIRPKISSSSTFQDFSILTEKNHGLTNLFFLQGIESPGLTSSLAIGNFIKSYLNNNDQY